MHARGKMTTQQGPWLILTSRYGGDTGDPSQDELASALREVYHENEPGWPEAMYEEHPNAWLRYGFDEGPRFILDVYRGGRVAFGQWADQDFETELAPEQILRGVDEETAKRLWSLLAAGEIDEIRSFFEGNA
jgi:hypothetical protein